MLKLKKALFRAFFFISGSCYDIFCSGNCDGNCGEGCIRQCFVYTCNTACAIGNNCGSQCAATNCSGYCGAGSQCQGSCISTCYTGNNCFSNCGGGCSGVKNKEDPKGPLYLTISNGVSPLSLTKWYFLSLFISYGETPCLDIGIKYIGCIIPLETRLKHQ